MRWSHPTSHYTRTQMRSINFSLYLLIDWWLHSSEKSKKRRFNYVPKSLERTMLYGEAQCHFVCAEKKKEKKKAVLISHFTTIMWRTFSYCMLLFIVAFWVGFWASDHLTHPRNKFFFIYIFSSFLTVSGGDGNILSSLGASLPSTSSEKTSGSRLCNSCKNAT